MSHLISHHLFLSALSHTDAAENPGPLATVSPDFGLGDEQSAAGETSLAVPLDLMPRQEEDLGGDVAARWMRDHEPEPLPPNW